MVGRTGRRKVATFPEPAMAERSARLTLASETLDPERPCAGGEALWAS